MAKLLVSEQEVETNSGESYLIVTGACASRIQEEIRALKNKTLKVDNMIKNNVQQVIIKIKKGVIQVLRNAFFLGI